MSYYIDKTIFADFDEAIGKVTEALRKEGFGVLSDIDIQEKFKEKLNIDFRKYRILGACHPPSAYKAIQHEDKIGTLLPCNVIVQEAGPGQIEVAAVDPVVSLSAVETHELDDLANGIREKLQRAIASL